MKSGAGYSILTYIAIKEEIARGELVAHRIGRPGICSSVAITTLRENPPSCFAAAWTALLQVKLKQFISTESWKADVVWPNDGAR